MILCLSTTLCVLATFAAAAVVALCVRRPAPGAVRQYLLAGDLVAGDPGVPALSFEALDDGGVRMVRFGVEGVTVDGAVSLAVSVKGFEVDIRERSVAGSGGGEPVSLAIFNLDFIAPERYHVVYRLGDDNHDFAAAFYLSGRQGAKTTIDLKI